MIPSLCVVSIFIPTGMSLCEIQVTVSIAVASSDAGYTKDDGTYVNMGDAVLEQLEGE